MSPNQNPEQIARDTIDAQLRAAGWVIQTKDAVDFHAGAGQAVREYTTDSGPADYVLFVDGHPVGVIEAKKETLGQNLTMAEDQTSDYAAAKLKWVQSTGIPLPFLYEATGVVTRFTDQRDPKPRSREVFSFHRQETLRAWLAAPTPGYPARSLRARIHDLPPLLDAVSDGASQGRGASPARARLESTFVDARDRGGLRSGYSVRPPWHPN